MKLLVQDISRAKKAPLLVLFALEGKTPETPEGLELPASFTKGFEGKARATRETFTENKAWPHVLMVGLGDGDKLDSEGLRRAAAVAIRAAKAKQVTGVGFYVSPCVAELAGGEEATGRDISEGAYLGAHVFAGIKKDSKPSSIKQLILWASGAAFKRGAQKGELMANACNFTRDLQDASGNNMRPRDLAAQAKKLATRSPQVRCRIFDEKAMAAFGMGLLLSVSQGSDEGAKLIHLTYKPKKKAKGIITFVGKGLTFDAGGISIKPSPKMEEMRYDMSGGAAVLGLFHALGDLDLPYEVHGVVGASENTINGKATKPGDIHVGMNGTSVEIQNTDAEGRLLLADCLTYAQKKTKPDTLFDLATLTGAVIVGLGHELTGIFPSNDDLRDKLIESGERTGEYCWPLPLMDVHKDAMKGQVADLKNIGPGSLGAGSTQGAAFLSYFIDEGQEWCHLDIAGTAWNAGSRDWSGGSLGTGVGTRLLIEYLERR
ncbi:MAG: leucyl aminopeptidase family protein [Planctomycetes bacterium]|nr:leucyl aminopeptidase family protein [Planctomycetota bacterium]